MSTRRKVAWALATWFGCGRVPIAPGTAGAAGAIPLYLLAAQLGRLGVGAAAILATAVGVWASSIVAGELKAKDPQVIVIDEVAGFVVTMLAFDRPSLAAIVAGFVVFRVLDAAKPGPIRDLERLPGGWGVVLDDVGAGLVGAAALALARAVRLLP